MTVQLAFSEEEYATRLAATRREMSARGLDLLISTDPSNMAWLTGYDGWSFYVHQCVVISTHAPPIWFGREQDANGALRTVYLPPSDIIGYPDNFVQSTERHPYQYLAAQLQDRKLASGVIGVEMDNYWYSAQAHQELVTNLPNARFDNATGLVNWRRAVKSPQELAYMRIAGRFVEKMHRRIAERVAPGMRKCDLVADIYDAGLRYDPDIGAGGDYPAIVPLLPSGTDAAAPHLTWDDQPMRAGEGTFFEIAGAYRRYHCPLSRTIFLGQPTQTFLEAEKAVLEGMEAGLMAAKSGNRCEDIANAFFGVLERHGIEKNNRAGYAIGLSYPPDWGERTMSIRRGDTTVLQDNMTFHFMTGLWMEDWGFEITESIVIGPDGLDCLTNLPRELLIKD